MWFRWLGVAGIELKIEHAVLVFDPFFTRPPYHKMFFGQIKPDTYHIHEKLPKCDHIFVSHAHYDHLMDVPEIAQKSGAIIYGSPQTCQILKLLGVPNPQIHEIDVGDIVDLSLVRIEVLPAHHINIPGFYAGPFATKDRPPRRVRDYRMDKCLSFYIEAEKIPLLDWCSNDAQNARPADILFAGYIINFKSFKTLIQQVRPRLIIPIHWDNFFRPLTKPPQPFYQPPHLALPPLQRIDLSQVIKIAKEIKPDVTVLIPEIFQPIDLNTYAC